MLPPVYYHHEHQFINTFFISACTRALIAAYSPKTRKCVDELMLSLVVSERGSYELVTITEKSNRGNGLEFGRKRCGNAAHRLEGGHQRAVSDVGG